MWIKMSLQWNEIHENYVFSGFYRIFPSFSRPCLSSRLDTKMLIHIHMPPIFMCFMYAVRILHGKCTEFFIYISIQFCAQCALCLSKWMPSTAWILHNKSNEYIFLVESSASVNVVFMKRLLWNNRTRE